MLVLGLVLIALAVLFAVAVLAGNTEPTTFELFNIGIDSSGRGIFLLGALMMLVLLSGVWLLQVGGNRSRQRRKEVKGLRKAAASQPSSREDSPPPVGPATTGRSDTDYVDLSDRETRGRRP